MICMCAYDTYFYIYIHAAEASALTTNGTYACDQGVGFPILALVGMPCAILGVYADICCGDPNVSPNLDNRSREVGVGVPLQSPATPRDVIFKTFKGFLESYGSHVWKHFLGCKLHGPGKCRACSLRPSREATL